MIKEITDRLNNIPAISKTLNFVKTNRKTIKFLTLFSLGVITLSAAVLFAGIRIGFNVSYSGKDIAVVSDVSVVETAMSIADKTVTDDKAHGALSKPKFSITLTVSDRLKSADQVANNIIENTDDICYATALKVNGETVACVSDEGISDALEARRTAYYLKDAKNEAAFVDNVELENGYFLKSEIVDLEDAKDLINKLKVKTKSVVKTNVVIPYKTVKKTTSSKEAGYSAVETKGVNGVSIRTESVVKVNGNVSSRKQLSNKVSKKAVDEVVIIGTAVKNIGRVPVSSANLICPISSGKFRISSYYGDGRNHKGLDMCANRGTPIYAAGGGTVTYAGYDSDFGYNVIIKHSNGISTRYAHASSLCVKQGQVVAQGDMIAAVGSTGWSTGNHLHFEVIVNGARVNPAPYIGL